MEFIMSAPFQQRRFPKHSRGSLGSAPTSNVLELSDIHQGMFKYCTHYVWKGASYMCSTINLLDPEIQWFPSDSSRWCLVITAGFLGLEPSISYLLGRHP